MKYILKAGTLYAVPNVLQAKMKSEIVGKAKKIFHADGRLALKTEIRFLDLSDRSPGDVRNREYLILDPKGTQVAKAWPDYAPEEDPLLAGWPLSHLPRVDRARIFLADGVYTLSMRNSQNYTMQDAAGKTVLQIMHRGVNGGWNIEADNRFSGVILCALFAFCRYIEQENELMVV